MGVAKCVFFLHIPKTGGRSVIRHIEDWAGTALVHEVPANEEYLSDLDTDLTKCQAVHGHQHFPFCALLGGDPLILTVLRDPVERVISSYEYILRKSDHVLRSDLLARVDSLETYVADSVFRFHSANMQTRMLGSKADLAEIVESVRSHRLSSEDAAIFFRRALEVPCDLEMLERASNRLLSDSVLFGLTEDIHNAIDTFAAAFGAPVPPVIYTENSAPRAEARSRWDRYPEGAIQAVIRANAFDLDLYAIAANALATPVTDRHA